MDDPPTYSRAPILEAVLEFQFAEPSSDRDLERLRDRFKQAYPSVETNQSIHVTLLAADKATATPSLLGYKMTSEGANDVLLIQKNAIGTIRLAPYDRWETMRATAMKNYETFAKVVGRKKITRVGARYINRFDVPSSDILGKPLDNFLNVSISLPPSLAVATGPYAFTLDCIEATTRSKVRLQSGIGPPALLDHMSITLDIDAYLDEDVPGRMNEVWDCADVLRNAKNAVFESSITNELRAYIR